MRDKPCRFEAYAFGHLAGETDRLVDAKAYATHSFMLPGCIGDVGSVPGTQAFIDTNGRRPRVLAVFDDEANAIVWEGSGRSDFKEDGAVYKCRLCGGRADTRPDAPAGRRFNGRIECAKCGIWEERGRPVAKKGCFKSVLSVLSRLTSRAMTGRARRPE